MGVEGAEIRRVGRRGLAGLAGAGVGAVSQFLMVMVVTRVFDATTAGSFFALTAACLILAGIVRLDAGNILIYFAVRHDMGRNPAFWSYFRSALLPVVLISLLISIFVFCFPDLLGADIPGDGPGYGERSFAAVRLLAMAFPIIVLAEVLVGASRGFGSMRPTVWLGGVLQPVGQLTLVAAVAVCWWSGSSTGGAVPWLAAAWAVPYLPVLVIGAVWLGRRVRREPYRRGAAGEFWRHAGPRSLGAAVQNVFQRLDVVIVALLAGPAQAAVYTAATRFKVLGQLAGQGLAQAAQPALVRALADDDLAAARAIYQRTTMWLILLTWPIWLACAAFAPALLGIFGPGYGAGAGILLVVAATMMFASACGMADVALVAAGRTTASLAGIVTATAVTVLLDLLLVPTHGALGAALGWSAGVIVKNALPLAQIWHHHGLRPFGPHSLTHTPPLPRLPLRPRPRSRPSSPS